MARYILRRVLQFIPVFLIATFIVYALVFAMPGDPIRALAGDRPLPQAVQDQIRADYHLDRNLFVQYWFWITGIFQGDFGTNFNGRSVSSMITQQLPTSARLAAVAFVFQGIIGITAGILAGVRQKGFVDTLVGVTTVTLIAIPTIVMAIILQLVFAVQLGWFPVAGINQGWYSYLLPGMALGSLSMAMIARLVRTTLAENLNADYVRTAVAKGATRRRVVVRHALRNSLIPVVTFLGADLGAMLGGTIIIERIFNLPGLGRQVFLSISGQEGVVVVGIVVLFILFFVFINLFVDILYAYLDPRIRYE